MAGCRRQQRALLLTSMQAAELGIAALENDLPVDIALNSCLQIKEPERVACDPWHVSTRLIAATKTTP